MKGDKVEAKKDFELASDLDPSSADVRFNCAALLHSLGEFGEAERQFSTVIAMAPDDPSAYKMRSEA